MSDKVRWRRFDSPAVDDATISERAGGWSAAGSVEGVLSDWRAYAVNYEVRCEASWAMREAIVSARVGHQRTRFEFRRSPAGLWTVNNEPRPELDGCADLTFEFSPVSHMLAIRRLVLRPGQSAAASAVVVRFPDCALGRIEQRYSCLDRCRYLYESGGQTKVALDVTGGGMIVRFGELWKGTVISDSLKRPA